MIKTLWTSLIFTNIDLEKWQVECIKNPNLGFPGCTVVRNPSANAEDKGLSPGPGGSHMPRSTWARVSQLLSLRSGAREPRLLSPRATTPEVRPRRARVLQRGRQSQWEAHAPQLGVAFACCSWRETAFSNKDPMQPKINKLIKKKKKESLTLELTLFLF